MKYIAIVHINRNGAKLKLYLKLWFIKIPIDGYANYITENVWFIIDQDVERWKKYYGSKLTIIDKRKNN